VFPTTLETERLSLERLSRETVDLRTYHEYCSRDAEAIDEVTRYLPWNPHDTLQDTREYLRRMEREWEAGERAEYVVRPTTGDDASEIAGSAGLICEWEKDLAKPTIWLRRRFWGRGYSGERADALLRVAFEHLGVGVVAIPLHGENDRSFRAVETYVERHGGRYEGRLRNHAGRYDDPADHHRFSISRAEYRSAADDGD
jgi:Acetyltransferases, including N-acetylases of ribosomal proteins